MGHKLQGVRSHYFKPDPETLLEGTAECKGYVHAIDSLSINEENRLSKQVQELKEKDDYKQYIIDKKMQEKEDQIKVLNTNYEKLSNFVLQMAQRYESIDKKQKEIEMQDENDMKIGEEIELDKKNNPGKYRTRKVEFKEFISKVEQERPNAVDNWFDPRDEKITLEKQVKETILKHKKKEI